MDLLSAAGYVTLLLSRGERDGREGRVRGKGVGREGWRSVGGTGDGRVGWEGGEMGRISGR